MGCNISDATCYRPPRTYSLFVFSCLFFPEVYLKVVGFSIIFICLSTLHILSSKFASRIVVTTEMCSRRQLSFYLFHCNTFFVNFFCDNQSKAAGTSLIRRILYSPSRNPFVVRPSLWTTWNNYTRKILRYSCTWNVCAPSSIHNM